MWACNYDFAHDNSHSSDLNVVSFCEGKRQHFDEVLPLHLERDGTFHLHQRNAPPLPRPPLSSSSSLTPVYMTLAAGMPYQAGDKNKELRRITEGYGSSLKHFRGSSTSSVSYKSENKVSAGSDAELIR